MAKLWLTVAACSLVWAASREVKEAGFSVTIPDDWKLRKYEQGVVTAISPDPSRFVFVRPILGRGADCQGLLQRAFSMEWAAYPGARAVSISAVQGNRALAVARFEFRGGRSRGEVLCAETSSRTAMFYGLSAPAGSFGAEVAGLVGILRSFRYGGDDAPAASASTGLPRMVQWVEPNERAFTTQVPEGWRVTGGLKRLDATHARSGLDVTSPDGASLLRFGDPRVPQCTVPGPGMAQFGNSGGLNLCPERRGREAGALYLQQYLIRDWALEQLNIVKVEERSDLSNSANQSAARFGLNLRNSFAQIQFTATRQGRPVQGWMLVNTPMMGSVGGQNFMIGQYTTEIQVFVGPAAITPQLASIGGAIVANTHWSPEWYQREQRIGREITDRTLADMRAQGENQQRAFWDRMASADKRAAAVGDILSGTVRLSDGQGNTYQAPAGSNYYFQSEELARTAGKRDDAVVGRDLYPAPLVDLRPLEVIQ